MNRSFANVLFGAVGSAQVDTSTLHEDRPITKINVEDAKFILEQADRVVIVPDMEWQWRKHNMQFVNSVMN